MSNVEFRKSSYSGGSNNCVEVAETPALHAIRDSKTQERGPLTFDRNEWRAFLNEVKRGRL
ncbi:uncharacterized protein DUF397 [Haloactinospora alba]|uniref:Uncharacterized protein DUF397 n=1 Tax=Haloactinospora alba TaxID=405555 RepID=A0A543N6Z9_9ACTN|nr:DUF397 domain-containing protein [Haloactinospora alba]TQN27583.1 uncharacterized protein DUF397 [Haloactinospora alba]